MPMIHYTISLSPFSLTHTHTHTHTHTNTQDKLGEVVFVELPEVGSVLEANEQFGVLESVKAVAEVYSPVSGKVTGVNRELENSPNKINEDPLGEGISMINLF